MAATQNFSPSIGFANIRCFVARLLIASACIIAAPSLAQASSSNITAAREAMAAGIKAVNAGDLLGAKRDFAQAVALTPKIAEGHAALGAVLLSLGEFNEAERELKRAHNLSPADGLIDLNLANAEVSVTRYADAVTLFHAALAADPRLLFSPQDSIAFAAALTATGHAGEAESTLHNAIETSPASAELQDALGTVIAKRGAMEEAFQLFQRAVMLDPSLMQAQYHLGTALLALNRAYDAVNPLRLVADKEPQDFDAQLQLGRALSTLH